MRIYRPPVKMGGDKKSLDDLFALYHGVLATVEEVSAQGQALKAIFLKIVTVSVASYFEAEAKETIRALSENLVGERGKILVNFIEKGILKRGYHNLFAWDEPTPNANKFYSFFNDESKKFVKYMKEREKDDKGLSEAARCFVELGKARNDLVHNDLASLPFNLSMEEVEEKYCKAQQFLPKFLHYAMKYAEGESAVGEAPPPAP